MNREIKFKGKRIDNDKWMVGDLNHLVDGMYISNDHGSNMARVYPDTVGQYTGLKDKNGKEIYNGDILAHDGNPMGYVVDGVRGYCFDVVFFFPGRPEIKASWSLYGTVVNNFNGDVEIIGNIHDKQEGGEE
jgi:uncharacterized phage protein (TIGR01671 family)